MTATRLDIVSDTLRGYANRGVFHGLSESGDGEFKLVWFYHRPMRLTVDSDVLCFRRILPGVAARSTIYAEVKRFIQAMQAASLPEHRRVDPTLAELTCSNRGGQVSVSLRVRNNEYAYGVKKIVNLVHELFVYLRESHPEYLMENFDAPQE